MPHNLIRLVGAVWLMAGLIIATPTTPIAHAGQNNGLCAPRSDRLSVAKNFILDACFDGKNLYLVNNTELPLDVRADGSAGQPYQFPVGVIPAIPSLAFTYIDPADTGLIMPGYELRIPIGSGSAGISVGGTNDNRSYVLVRALVTWIPTKGFAQAAQQIPQLANELESVWIQYQDCVTRKGFFGKLGCEVLYYRNVAFALGRFGIGAGAQGALGGVLNLLDTAQWAAKSANDVTALLHGTKTLHINPVAATPGPARPPTPVSTPPPTPVPARPPTPVPTSPPTPVPARPPTPVPTPPPTTYPETTGGNAHTWTNYTNAGGYEGPTISSNATVQIACKVAGFVVADGDPWWYRVASNPWNNSYYVSADAFYNNGQTSGSLHGTPFVDPNVPSC